MRRQIWILIALCACGDPPGLRPTPSTVASVYAAAAAAATLAMPEVEARNQEERKQGEPANLPVNVSRTVPAEAFDQLDEAASDGGVGDGGVGDGGVGDGGLDGGPAPAP